MDPRILQASGEIVVEGRRTVEEATCKESSSLETTFVSDTYAYGVMFTVTGKKDLLLIDTLEISAVVLANLRGVHVMVYTKEGSYENFHSEPEQWVKIADTVIVPAQEGRGTLIPPKDFHPVQVAPRSQRAFYVTLDTTDLRYSNSQGRPVGDVYVEDDFLQIHVGAGLLEYPFANKVFTPRVFCGVVHYRRMVDCNKVGIVDTEVSYHFVVQHDSLSENTIKSRFNSIVSETMTALLESKFELSAYKKSADLKLDSVDTEMPLSPFNAEAYAECTSNTVRTCTSVVSRMNFVHSDKLESGDLTFHILQQRASLSSNLDKGQSMDVVYVGIIPMKSDMIVRLRGVPSGQNMNLNQLSFFEKTTRKFLDDRLSRLSSLDILNVHVEVHEQYDPRSPIQRRQLQDSEELSFVDVFATILGTVKPPSTIDFDMLTEDTIQSSAAEYIHELKVRGDLALDSSDSIFFAEINSVSTKPTNGTKHYSDLSLSDEGGRILVWGVCILVLLVLKVIAIAVFLCRRRRHRKRYEKEDIPLQDTPSFDDTDQFLNKAYENSHDVFVDESEYDLTNRQVFDGNPRFMGMKKAHSAPFGEAPSFLSSRGDLAARSWQVSSTRSMDDARSGSVLSQRNLVSQYSASAIGASSETAQNKDTSIARGSHLENNNASGYTANQRGPASHSSSTGLTSIYRPSQRGWAKKGSNTDVDGSPAYWPSQLSDFESSQHTVISESSRGTMSQPFGHGASQRSLTSQSARGNLSISSSERDLVPDMIRPGSVRLARDGTVKGAIEESDRASAQGVRGDGSSSNVSQNKFGVSTELANVADFPPATTSQRVPSQIGSHVGDSMSMMDVSSFMRSAATLSSTMNYSTMNYSDLTTKRDNRSFLIPS